MGFDFCSVVRHCWRNQWNISLHWPRKNSIEQKLWWGIERYRHQFENDIGPFGIQSQSTLLPSAINHYLMGRNRRYSFQNKIKFSPLTSINKNNTLIKLKTIDIRGVDRVPPPLVQGNMVQMEHLLIPRETPEHLSSFCLRICILDSQKDGYEGNDFLMVPWNLPLGHGAFFFKRRRDSLLFKRLSRSISTSRQPNSTRQGQ